MAAGAFAARRRTFARSPVCLLPAVCAIRFVLPVAGFFSVALRCRSLPVHRSALPALRRHAPSGTLCVRLFCSAGADIVNIR